MKKIIALGFILSLVTIFSCQKDLLTEYALTESAIQNASTTGSAADLNSYAIVERGDSTENDSSECHCHNLIPLSPDSLSQTIKNYVASNYVGGSILKAGTASNGNVYVMLKTTKGTVVLAFTSNSTFLQICKKYDEDDDHDGDNDDDHDSTACHCHDLNPLPLNSLSQTIKNYVTSNYPSDSIVKAGAASNGKVFVMLKTTLGPVVLVFASDGTFLQICKKHGDKDDHDGDDHDKHGDHDKLHLTQIDISSLPSAVTSYIASTYPGASIKKAGTDVNGSFFILVENNGQAIILIFNADGSFNKLIKKK